MKGYLIFILALALMGCPEKYETGHFKESVINFEDVNSEYDDYNSSAPFIYYKYLFHFSSNRNSLGKDFDIVGENMYIDWSKTEGTLEIGTDLDDDRFDYITPMFDAINTSCNEMGPYSLLFRQNIDSSEELWANLLMFASNCDGHFDIKFAYYDIHNYNTVGETGAEIKQIQNVDFLNSSANDMYPTFYGKDLYYYDEWGIDDSKIKKIFFCSDREGKYNLYSAEITGNMDIINSLESNSKYEINMLELNSEQDDKCPFVNGKLLVFASNRPGGYGGYDLYYSHFEDGSWSEPKNFGGNINTEYDEYRPITIHHDQFINNLMIFSSNRPGGKGGFDLYHVGISQMIK